MPRRTPPKSIEARAREEAMRTLDDLVSAVAAELGPAEGAAFPSEHDDVDLWGQRDPRVDHDEVKALLMAGTFPPEWADPNGEQGLAFVKVNPEWAAWLAQNVSPDSPLDEAMASEVAEAMEWPFRASVYGRYADDPERMVEHANAVDARWKRRLGLVENDGHGYAQGDVPVMPPPTSTPPLGEEVA